MVFSNFPVGFVDFNGCRFAFRVLGEGSPLLLVMGSGGTMDMWAPHLLHELSKYFKVVIFDNRGMGYSTCDGGDFSIGGFAEDAAGLIGALGLGRPDVLGWSMGGEVALELAVRHPGKVNHLVVYAGDCGGKEVISASPEIMDRLNRSSGLPAEMAHSILPLMFPQRWYLTHPHPERYFRQIHESSPPEHIRMQGEAMAQWAGVFDRLPEIKHKTLLVHGDQDIIVPPENSRILHERISKSKLIMYPHAGHCLMYEHPLKMAGDLIAFLKS